MLSFKQHKKEILNVKYLWTGTLYKSHGET